MSYHLAEINPGVFGTISKIQEELDEIKDSVTQNNRIMTGVELADLIGAIEEFATNHGYSLNDLIVMKDATKRAFESNHRSSNFINKLNFNQSSFYKDISFANMLIINKQSCLYGIEEYSEFTESLVTAIQSYYSNIMIECLCNQMEINIIENTNLESGNMILAKVTNESNPVFDICNIKTNTTLLKKGDCITIPYNSKFIINPIKETALYKVTSNSNALHMPCIYALYHIENDKHMSLLKYNDFTQAKSILESIK